MIDLIYKAKFTIEENTPLCLLGDKFFGFLKLKQKSVVICTENAKKIGGYYFMFSQVLFLIYASIFGPISEIGISNILMPIILFFILYIILSILVPLLYSDKFK